MGKGIRVKCFVLLLIVLFLLYGQQSGFTYTAEAEEKKEVFEVKEESEAGSSESDHPEDSSSESDHPEDSSSESDHPEDSSSESGHPEDSSSESGHPEDSSSEGDSSETENDPPKADGSDNESTGNEGSEVERPGSEEETPPTEEPPEKITEYELYIPDVNGKNGYYTEKPKIKICHTSEAGVTKYSLKKGEKTLEEGTLKEKDDKAEIKTDSFLEGKHVLHLYMENEEGEKLEKYEIKKEILIDTKKPQIQMSAPGGFEIWYQEAVPVSAEGKDAGSGIQKLSCIVSGKVVESTDQEKHTFLITHSSVLQKGVLVTVTAEDRAGNKSELTKTVYLDKEVPKVSVTGLKNYTVTAQNVKVMGTIEEENALKNFRMEIVREDEKGKKEHMTVSDWDTKGIRKTGNYTLKEDGIYEITLSAEDLSGHRASQIKQVIVDKTNPLIRYIDRLDGKYLQKFRWSYKPHQMIGDLTTYTYDMRLDGQLYRMGQTVYTEGTHKFTVKAVDSAGNHARAEAEFVIDHTAPEIVFKNIEEGEEYEKERTFTVGVRGEADTIRQIQINGENQPLDFRKRTYEYTLHDCQDYEVTVSAEDKAGNQAKKTIYFKIVPEKTLAEKITEPMKKYFHVSKQNGNDSETEKQIAEIKEKRGISLPLKLAGTGIAGMAVGVIVYMFKKKNGRDSTSDI